MQSNTPSPDAVGTQLPSPSAETPSITFESLTFSDGTVIELDPNDVVLFVGPNNAGKSAALREVEGHVGPPLEGTVIKTAKLRRTGTTEELRKLVETHARMSGDNYSGVGFNIQGRFLEHYWQNDLSQFRTLFCQRIATETRITGSNPVGSIAVLDQLPTHPIQLLFIDERIEDRISGYFRRAFGEELILFRAGGSSWPLLVGSRPDILADEHRFDATYNERLRAATVQLREQGDGMRSFATVILYLLAPDTPSLLVLDEPEAFLHPPQARLLGEFIAKERPPRSQLFVATHSPDVLQGLLSAAPDNLRIVRIQRDGSVNRVKELDKARAKAISADPVMKFTSVLSGVFHTRVIICESDADCMFYSALLDLQEVHGSRYPDVLFVQAGGKDRMYALAGALRSLDVSVDVIADIDILNNENALERLVIALGGNWDEIRDESRPLKAAIEERKSWPDASEVAKKIGETLDKTPKTGAFPKDLRERIEAILRKISPWDAVKAAGKAAIPSGQPTKHYDRMQALCNGIGLWIVPVGEVEGFCKSEGDHGPGWVHNVLENHDLHTDTQLEEAREFVRRVWGRVAP